MGMTKLLSSAMAKTGVNYVRNIVESSNSIFHEVHQENDFGVDAHVELVEGTDVKGKLFAIQIKSGSSYCNKNSFYFSATKDHFEYWAAHSLPVLGVVYDPNVNKGYWVHVTEHIRNRNFSIDEGPYSIIKRRTEMHTFNFDTFERIIKPTILGNKIKLPFNQARRFFLSDDYSQHILALDVLTHEYSDKPTFWEDLFYIFRNRSAFSFSESIVYCLADLACYPNPFRLLETEIPEGLIRKIRLTIERFTVQEVAKILEIYDEDDQFERYPVGQSAEAVIATVKEKESKLLSLINDSNYCARIRNSAAILYAYYVQEDGQEVLETLRGKYRELDWLDVVADEVFGSLMSLSN